MSNSTAVNPADLPSSHLYSLARIAMATSVVGEAWVWPTLDFSDPAQRRFGDYELLAELGRGGMGVVYRAHQRSLDREVALKFIAVGMADTLQVARFVSEARAVARLVHPGIVPVFEVGSVGEVHFYSMPLIEGESLEARLQRQPMAEAEVVDLMLKICEAIDYAHRLGLLHLDLKPANVLIDARGEPLVADFGLARHVDANGGVSAQEVSGTPAFMAPEQILIEQFRLTAATDIYALGALLYRCLAGVSPHGDGTSADLIRRALAGQIPHLRDVIPQASRDLAAICTHCLALDPKDRYASVRALAADLRRVESGLAVSVRSPGWLERVGRWLRREPKLALATAITFAAVTLGALTTISLWQRSETARMAEAEQRELALLSAALGGHLYAHSVKAVAERPTQLPPATQDPRVANLQSQQRTARAMIEWLQQQLPDDPTRQARVLRHFAEAMSDSQSRDQLGQLLRQVVVTLGHGYRLQVIAALEAKGDVDSLTQAAVLAWQDERTLAQPLRVKQLLDRAIAINPDHVFARFVAATFCSGAREDQCAQADATEQMLRLQPDDGYAWLVLAARQQGAPAYAALHEAASRMQFGSQLARLRTIHVDALVASGVSPPPLVAEPARILAPDQPVELTIGRLESWSQPVALMTQVVRMCNPDAGFPAMPDDAGVRADCVAVGAKMATDSGSLMVAQFGAMMVAKLAPGSPQDLAIQVQRMRTQYLSQQLAGLTPAQHAEYPAARFQSDVGNLGETEAMARKAAHFGIPTEPPAGWSIK